MANYTEHTIKLPDGIEIYYTDSGAPSSSSYTTLVVLHGSAFNGRMFNEYGFVPLHNYAHQNNLRVILWNRRDYHGSTKYTDAELEDLKAGRKIFQDRLALQLAWFFEHFITHESTPKLSPDRKSGGFVIMGWSFGNATLLSLFSDPAIIPKALYETVEPYLMSIVLYDPPHIALGYTLPCQESFYSPFSDPDYPTPELIYDNFQHWVSSYYKHPDIASGKPSGMCFAKRTEKRTVSSWTEEQKEKYFDTLAAVRSELPAYAPPMQATLKVQTQQALFNVNLVSSYFPQVKVLYITGIETCYYCMWGYMESSRLYAEAVAHGEKVRPTKFKLVEGGNHFLHYDMPDVFLQEVVHGCTEF
ncbi:Alpha/Beta hydrolase protein [Mycena capillaripes]|nr:Alpha/Beta hydrolase protein [Mycena capillaripes]